MIIKVTQEHINLGVTSDCDKCPVALVLKELFPSAKIKVVNYNCYINNKRYKLPQNVVNFIQNFDRKLSTKPFEFELDI